MIKCALQHFAIGHRLWSDCIEQYTIFFQRRFSRCPWFQNLGQITTPGTTSPTLCNKCVGSSTSPTNQNWEDAGDRAYGLSSLPKKTRMSNCLQMSLQRQHILLRYFKTLSVGPVWVLNPNLLHSSPVLIHVS